ncbi:hypothetical protein HDU92_006528 [Lobulomyces angularis]|nr:hypothetical protein HDU92_006528 [Lobulomyces angularis]
MNGFLNKDASKISFPSHLKDEDITKNNNVALLNQQLHTVSQENKTNFQNDQALDSYQIKLKEPKLNYILKRDRSLSPNIPSHKDTSTNSVNTYCDADVNHVNKNLVKINHKDLEEKEIMNLKNSTFETASNNVPSSRKKKQKLNEENFDGNITSKIMISNDASDLDSFESLSKRLQQEEELLATKSDLVCKYYSVFVGQLLDSHNENDLIKFFGNFVNVSKARIMRDKKSSKSLNCALVYFKNEEDVEEVLKKKYYEIERGVVIKVEPEKKKDKEKFTLFVRNLVEFQDEQWLENFFSKFGKVVNINLLKDKLSGKPKGCGFVYFDNKDDLEYVLSKRSFFIEQNRKSILVEREIKKSEEQTLYYINKKPLENCVKSNYNINEENGRLKCSETGYIEYKNYGDKHGMDLKHREKRICGKHERLRHSSSTHQYEHDILSNRYNDYIDSSMRYDYIDYRNMRYNNHCEEKYKEPPLSIHNETFRDIIGHHRIGYDDLRRNSKVSYFDSHGDPYSKYISPRIVYGDNYVRYRREDKSLKHPRIYRMDDSYSLY